MRTAISQRELRNDNAEIMRRVEAGESFTVTRHGKPVADVVPHEELPPGARRMTGRELQTLWRSLPPIDTAAWSADLQQLRELVDPGIDRDPWVRRPDSEPEESRGVVGE